MLFRSQRVDQILFCLLNAADHLDDDINIWIINDIIHFCCKHFFRQIYFSLFL
ncbi:hypothetical protein N878_28080 [Pseudomonas sp. EGD-AK9]|nr:hypothetical protein N878_28080 [Pseudomonas sp. EGD-AK9]